MKEPLLDAERIRQLVKRDEDLRMERSRVLHELLQEQGKATENQLDQTLSLMQWRKAIDYWQEQRDEQNPHRRYHEREYETDEEVFKWSTKEIFENRERQVEGLRNDAALRQRNIDGCKRELERVDEKRIKIWRDIVLGRLGEKEEGKLSKPESVEENFGPDSVRESNSGSDSDTDRLIEVEDI